MIRHFWPVAAFCALATLTTLGAMEIFLQARMNLVLIRLPEVPPISHKSETLREKINGANAKVRKKLANTGVNKDFGRAVGEMGRLYQANQFYDQALSCYRLAVEYDEESAMWFYLSAFIHQQRGETASMIGFLEQTLRLSNDYSPAVLKLADTYFKAGQMRQAKFYYEQRLALTPGDPYALMGLARIALDKGKWDVAEAQLQKAISSNPKFGDAHRLMAQIHEYHGRIDEMHKSLDMAADSTRFRPASDPWIDDLEDLCYDPEQLLVRGSMALTELDMETAIKKHIAKALEIDPENPEANLAMGKAWLMAGDWSRAYRYLMRTIELDPSSDQAYFQIGLILQNENKLAEAEAMMRKALEFQPNNANVQNNLGVILLEQQSFDEAIESFKVALEIYPEHINARYNLGMSLWASGNSKAAVTQYHKVLEMKPDWGAAANSLAWILATDPDEKVRHGDDALKWARIAVQGKYRNNPEYLDTLAAAYAETGQFEMAVDTVRRALIILRAVKDRASIETIESRLRLYESGSPFHEKSKQTK
jgi:HemY protein